MNSQNFANIYSSSHIETINQWNGSEMENSNILMTSGGFKNFAAKCFSPLFHLFFTFNPGCFTALDSRTFGIYWQTDRRTTAQIGRGIDIPTDQWWNYGWTEDKRTDGWTNGRTYRKTDREMDRWTHGWEDEWTNRQTDRLIDRRTDGQAGTQIDG